MRWGLIVLRHGRMQGYVIIRGSCGRGAMVSATTTTTMFPRSKSHNSTESTSLSILLMSGFGFLFEACTLAACTYMYLHQKRQQCYRW